jgi:hypothetical protein
MKHLVKHQATPWAGQSVWFTQDLKTLKKLAKTYKITIDLEGANGVTYTTKGPYVIYVRPGADMTTLVHETGHATMDILDYCGVDPRQANGEPFCYTQQAMLRAFLPHFKSPKTPK